MTFKVIDKKTGKEADEYEIALKEDWAKDLMYCDMEGFALLQDGTLILVDECGRFEYCPADRFEIVFEEERPQGEWIDLMADKGYVECPFCHKQITGGDLNFCVKCGADMRTKESEDV